MQREEQHAKQIQEMKNAYEQQYRKLSEFIDFVKRYFPYVEKLIPTIKFLHDTLNFGNGLIKSCTCLRMSALKVNSILLNSDRSLRLMVRFVRLKKRNFGWKI